MEIKIPYCKSDFKAVRQQNYEYVDKTHYIYELEKTSQLMYCRPRRFGKTMLSSMLSCYYDIKEKDNFEELFKGLEIYNNPTENKNNYYILKFNFSGMSDTSNINIINDKFSEKVKWFCYKFIEKYNLDIKMEEKPKYASEILNELLAKFSGLNLDNKIYVIIDEYDHFTNSMLGGNLDRFNKAVGKDGFVRDFYEVIKEYSEGTDTVIDRFFATGVAPLTLDSLTSGFNIATDISLDSNFVAMCGLTEDEVKCLLEKCNVGIEIYDELKKNYNGYRFSKTSDTLTFNTTLVMYYLRDIINNNTAPEDLIDTNIASSFDKIEMIVGLKNREQNIEQLTTLITTGEVSGNLVRKFDFTNIDYDKDTFLSLLYYNGYITIKDVNMLVTFRIPNYVSEALYSQFFKDIIENDKKFELKTDSISNAIIDLGMNGNIVAITDVVSKFLTHMSVRDKENFNEKTLKFVYSMFLSLSNQYYTYAEYPANQGYIDLYIQKSAISKAKYEAVIELKYLKKVESRKLDLQMVVENAKLQLKKYMEDNRINDRENLKKFVVIFEGFEKYYIEEI